MIKPSDHTNCMDFLEIEQAEGGSYTDSELRSPFMNSLSIWKHANTFIAGQIQGNSLSTNCRNDAWEQREVTNPWIYNSRYQSIPIFSSRDYNPFMFRTNALTTSSIDSSCKKKGSNNRSNENIKIPISNAFRLLEDNLRTRLYKYRSRIITRDVLLQETIEYIRELKGERLGAGNTTIPETEN
jgi:hypothetical protein